ncbi:MULTISPECIES: NPP1 family protein [unclassified Streptomyces]|uniref:NPP1 family protein n=1 Tax=unclassified Streptomyces TaxID=2593676 RepID=UPI002E37093B|nr:MULTISPECIES: NPP1 family protein [unclassified Streptomyces]WUC68550.1 NPP1 family protein [Streptomyces sp. NBC_00539]
MTNPQHAPRHRLRRILTAAGLGAASLVMTLPTAAVAAVIPQLPQNADGLEQTFSPAYDYDRDGCYATAAISPDGTANPGLKPGGDVNGHCRDLAQLQNSNTYSRAKCNNGWCAVMYASYFEKDQATLGPAAIGHRHDFEHVVVWIKDNQVEYVSTSQHSGWKWYPRSQVRFDGTHPKAVYHKDGASTHFFRLANGNDEPAENHTGNWFFPRLVGWNGYPAGLRDRLMNADFGAATIKISDPRFNDALNAAKPPVPFNPYG